MVYMMPNPEPSNQSGLPIILVEYQVPENGKEQHHSFGFKATSLKTAEMQLGSPSMNLPAIVWGGDRSVLCLAFTTEAQRTACLKRLGRNKRFGLSLEHDLQQSFLLRHFNASIPGDDVEFYHVVGSKQTIMSRKLGQYGFVVVDPSWSAPPAFLDYGSVGRIKVEGNWIFVPTSKDVKRQCVCIIECANGEIAQEVSRSLQQHAQRQISASESILSVIVWDLSEPEIAFRSHSDSGEPNRIPFNTAWDRFRKSIRNRDYFGGQGQDLRTRGGAV